ncbi:hypothetical protein [Pseudonocardia sp. MH-G8]|uniref:hypothetical protein n=1 Tax=Pseudonocardia sp. MH-G8 TaxID=1854588 RepID=UPI00117B0EF0|nr:hypothetical protein [Pseudonocardia sp. MH-G8]
MQIADIIANRGPVLDASETAVARSQIAAVRDRVDRLTAAGPVPHEVATELRSLTRTAEAEVAIDQPDRSRTLTILTQLRNLAAGVAATAGIAESVDGIVRTITGAS